MDFNLTDDLEFMRKTIQDFANKEIAPIAADLDKNPRFPWQTLRKMGELGLMGIMTPEKYGGAGLNTLAYAVLLEEVAVADASHATIMSVSNGLPQSMILNFGSEEQKDKYLPKLASGEWIGAFCLTEAGAGSDAAALKATAKKVEGGWVLNGEKAWITSGSHAQLYLVMLKNQNGKGINCFIIEKDFDNLEFGKPEEKMGQHASITTTLSFNDCFVPDSALLGEAGKGLSYALGSLDSGRIGIAAQSVGIARASLELAKNYAEERIAFNKPIKSFQGISFKLADMALGLESARLLTHKAAWLKDNNKAVTMAASMAKLHASEMATKISHMAVQILGAYGYSKDYPAERYYRDARVTEIYEGSSEIQRLVISRELYR